ncbi:Rrf2 family transcriptional regulator [Myxococcota bacterium]|nr:Rrf2 family transcriptional regulator [Myxococcota bacterium]MBU1431529.1 Rrf2 family transcriptional regulator [Myxococcota bacterium]MBU1899626.1 Rrf2 family transcriptional regulator [Myxococcota bacterium]
MSRITQKTQYAIRAVLELSYSFGGAPLSVAGISKAQSIPARFLEQIIAELRRANIVKSHRGAHGGYTLVPAPEDLNIAQIIRLIDGDPRPVDCTVCGGERECELASECVFAPMWRAAYEAGFKIYEETSFKDLQSQDSEIARRLSQRE